jgi:acid phosphatase type 7
VRPLAVALSLLLSLIACADEDTPRRSAQSTTVPEAPDDAGVVLVAGDIALCERPEDEATAGVVAAALEEHPNAVVAVSGDLAYDQGTAAEFRDCYGPSWGRFKDKTKPTPGNHEYGTQYAAGYFDYFGAAAGEKNKGWYSYDVGPWHVVAINSNCNQEGVGGCGLDSEQGRWLAADLVANAGKCTLGYWHHPRFSSGYHGTDEKMEPLWQIAVKGGMDVIVNGHDHHYERFAPIDGTRQFVVGTGGAWRYPVVNAEKGSEVRHSGTPGVLKLVLEERFYRWEFLSVANAEKPFNDSGRNRCKDDEG